MENMLRGMLGMAAIIGVSYLLSKDRKNINWKLVITGLSIQFTLAIFILKADALTEFWSPLGWPMRFFELIAAFFVVVLKYTTKVRASYLVSLEEVLNLKIA